MDKGNIEQQSTIMDVDSVELVDDRTSLIIGLTGDDKKKYSRFVLAALSGVPWLGGVFGVLSALATLQSEKQQDQINELQRLWLQEHRDKIKELARTIQEILSRFDSFGDEIKTRIEDPQYINLVRKAFLSWDQADTQEKKEMIKKLITNAGGIALCPDDLVRLFINWINQYHEAHFMVIREIYKNPGISRGQIWDSMHDERPREDSAKADLFRYLIRDLNLGGVIRQETPTDSSGNFLKKSTRGKQKGYSSGKKESAFEDLKPYVLTELGSQFVHYVMDDLAPQLESDFE